MRVQDSQPVMAQLWESPPSEPGVADILIGALSLTGMILLLAVLVGVVLGGVFIAFRILRPPKPLRSDPLTR